MRARVAIVAIALLAGGGCSSIFGADFDVSLGGTGGSAASGPGAGTGGATTSSASAGGATSGSAGAMAGTGGVTTSSSASSGGAPVDCTSAGYSCVPQAPNGWQGPFQLYDGPPTSAPPCPNAAMPLLTANLSPSAPPANCSLCTCGTATGMSCGPSTVTSYATSDPSIGCPQTTCSQKYPVANGQCLDIAACGSQTGSFTADPPPAGGGQCMPSAQQPSLPPVSWQETALGCSEPPSLTGCDAASTCFVTPAAPFEAKACVSAPGDVACPAAYPSKRVFYLGVADSRACTACSCGPPTGTCPGTIAFYNDPGCTMIGTPQYGVPSGCTWKSSYVFARLTLGPPQGACPANPSQPTGDVAETQPVSVCCIQ